VGEAKRREAYDTLDGGPRSGDRIALELCTFEPGPAIVMSADRSALAALRELCLRMHRRPTPICGACDYEFEFGELPPLIYFTRPAFPKADDYMAIMGAICRGCARLPHEKLMQGLVSYLREIKPDIEILRRQ
jgi:hypothetical protein